MKTKITGLILFLYFSLLANLNTTAQKPREIHVETTPPDFTDVATWIALIAIPAILIIGYIFLRKRNK